MSNSWLTFSWRIFSFARSKWWRRCVKKPGKIRERTQHCSKSAHLRCGSSDEYLYQGQILSLLLPLHSQHHSSLGVASICSAQPRTGELYFNEDINYTSHFWPIITIKRRTDILTSVFMRRWLWWPLRDTAIFGSDNHRSDNHWSQKQKAATYSRSSISSPHVPLGWRLSVWLPISKIL